MVVLDLFAKLVPDLSQCWQYNNGYSALLVTGGRRAILYCMAFFNFSDKKTKNSASDCGDLIIGCDRHPSLHVDDPDQRPELFWALHLYPHRRNMYRKHVSNSSIHEISFY